MASPPHYRLRTGQSNKRGTGWEALHIAIDENSRLVYTEILRREEDEGHSLPRAGARLLPARTVDLKGGDPAAFNRALVFVGQVEAYAAAVGKFNLDAVLSALSASQRNRLRKAITAVDAVHDRIITRV